MPFPLGCKNICERLKLFSHPRYKQGLKFCRICEAAFKTVKDFCECCGIRLRVTRHDKTTPTQRQKHGRLNRLIRRAQKKRQHARQYYSKWKNDPSFKAKRAARDRSYYLRNAKRIKARALEYFYRRKKAKKQIVQIPVIS